MANIKYFCEGGCGGSVTEAQYEQGMNKCGMKGCPEFGKALVKKRHCPKCDAWFKDEEHCQCAAETPGG